MTGDMDRIQCTRCGGRTFFHICKNCDELNSVNTEELRKENANLKALVNVQEEYIKLLSDELTEVVPIAHAHGWKSKGFYVGKTLRGKIAEFKKGGK